MGIPYPKGYVAGNDEVTALNLFKDAIDIGG